MFIAHPKSIQFYRAGLDLMATRAINISLLTQRRRATEQECRQLFHLGLRLLRSGTYSRTGVSRSAFGFFQFSAQCFPISTWLVLLSESGTKTCLAIED